MEGFMKYKNAITLALGFVVFCSHAADSIDDMKAAIQADTQLAELARQLMAAKQNYDQALSKYKTFRLGMSPGIKLSAETAAVTVDADKAAGLEDSAAFAAAKAQTDAEKQSAAAAATRTYKDVAEKKRALEANVTVWKNKLLVAQRLKDQGERELAAADGSPPRSSTPGTQNPPSTQNQVIKPTVQITKDASGNTVVVRTGTATVSNPTPTGTVVSTVNYDSLSAKDKIAAANKDIQEAQQELMKAEQALAAIAGEVASAESAKKTADANAPVAPKTKKVIGIYVLNDGTTLEALSVMEAGDDYIIKTEAGMKTVKKTDVKDIRLQQ
jgi:hypothetical protein